MTKLYRDFFKRLLPPALILTLFFCLANVLVLFPEVRPDALIGKFLDYDMLMGANCLFPMLAGAVLTCAAFSFLHRRDASDLYLSFPCTRGELFGAAMGAALSWGALVLAAGLGTGCAVCLVGRAPFLPLQYIVLFFMLYTGFIAVCGCFAAANALTGRRLYALILGTVLTWLPRLMTVGVLSLLPGQTPIDAFHGPVLGIGTGWATTAPFFLLNEGSALDILSPVSAVWNVFFAANALLMGRVLFVHRRGETAGLVAQNRWLRRGITSSATLPVTLFFFCYTVSEWDLTWGTVLLAFGAALMLFLVLELIPERKLSVAFRALPALALSCALAATAALAGLLMGVAIRYTPIPAWAVKNVRLESYYGYTGDVPTGPSLTDIPYMRLQMAEKDLTRELAPVIVRSLKESRKGMGAYRRDNPGHASMTATLPLWGRVSLDLRLDRADARLVAETAGTLDGLALFPVDENILLVTQPGRSPSLGPDGMREVYDLLKTELTPEALLDESDPPVVNFNVFLRDGLFVDKVLYSVPYSCGAADLFFEKVTRELYAGFRDAEQASFLCFYVLPERGGGYGRFRDALTTDNGPRSFTSPNDASVLYKALLGLTPYERGAEKDFRVILTNGYVYPAGADRDTYVSDLCFTCTEAELEQLLGLGLESYGSRM